MTAVEVSPGPESAVRPLTLLRAFLRRDFGIALSYRLPFAFDLFQSILSVAFLYFLARVVGHKVLAATGLTISYFGFAVIGTTMVAVLTVSLTSQSRGLRGDQISGTLEVLLSMPAPPWLVVLCNAAYQVAYGMVAAVLSLAFAFALGLRFHVTALSCVVAVIDFIGALVIFCALGMALAAFVMVFKRGETLTTLAIGALGLIGGVLYPVSSLSVPLRYLADALPFTWALTTMRAALLGGQSDYFLLSLVLIAAVVLFPLSVWVFSRAMSRAKRKGTVGQY